ncbi:MAG: two-component regulator propeller domain-containing protein [Bacteroidota bacterium]
MQVLLLALLFLIPGPIHAAVQPFVEQLGIKDGLSNNEVRSIFQDRQGYLWFGTYDGLNRYNGYDFKIFRNRPTDSASIIHSFINAISEDKAARLWIGTRQGVSVFDQVTEKFSGVYAKHAKGGSIYQLKSYITEIKTDQAGNVFVASHEHGLIRFTNGERKAGIEVPFREGTTDIYDYNVLGLFITPNQQTYLLIDNKGLCFYDPKNGRITLMTADVISATCVYSEQNDIWIGTNFGLFHYDLVKRKIDATYRETTGGLSSDRVTSILSLPDKTLWIGTDGGGLNILDRRTGKITSLSAGFDHHSLSSNAVHALFIDKDGRKWIGTLRGGINIIDNTKDRFQNIAHDPTNPNSLINSFVKSVFEDKEEKLWIGTDGGGLSIWDRHNNHFTNFKRGGPHPGSISSNFITNIRQDYTGKVWVATYGGGIDRYQPESGNFKTYTGYNDKGKPVNVVFWVFCEDHFNNLWVSGLQDGLFLYDQGTDQFRVFDPALKNALSLSEDKRGALWAGTFDGLYEIDIRNKKHRYYPIGKPLRAIHEDRNGNLWLGTEAGLMLFDRERHRVIKQYTTDDGLSNNNVLNIEEDHEGRLWLSTFNGLSRFDVKQGMFTNFFQSDGLQNKEFNLNASLTLKNGQLAFGGINGLSLFDPKEILPLKNMPNIVLTDLKVNNIPVIDRPGYVTAASQTQIKTITVPYGEAALAISFSAIEFTAQERINYRYTMDGWDRGWNNIGKIRNAVYTRLNPGSYTFKVNCTNAEGLWIAKQAVLRVIILPPWYRTWWAYSFYLLTVFAGIYWYLSYRARETRLKYEIKLAKVDADNRRVLQEKERELNEKRLEFFTGISHEFRTPLSLIINPVKDLVTKSTGQDHTDLNIIYRNARRLLSLVDQLLLFRKADAGVAQLNIGPIPIIQAAKEVFLCFVQQARLAGIKFEFIAPEDEITIYGDREKIEIILFNLISNAIKYTPAGKDVKLIMEYDAERVILNIADNGSGIPAHVGDQLFNKFYRSRDTGQPVKAGFGIGLYLARQFTDDHKGLLTYQSVQGAGTTFSLTLKTGIDHYPEHIISSVASSSSEILTELAVETAIRPVAATLAASPVNYKAESLFTDRKTILIIDDDTELRHYIRSILEHHYVVFEAADGDQGLAMAKDKLPDLIVCDVMMPGLNGIELCAIIKQDAALSYIPMILLTASSSPEGKLKGLESGADDYISKPFEKDILVARVANLLQTRSNLQSYFYNSVTLKTTNVAISEEYKSFLEKCIAIVEKHIADPDFNVTVLAAEIGMSRSNLFRKVKSLSGHSINSFIRFIRLRKAAELLIQSDMNVNEVALEAGFNNVKYFRTQFHKLFGTNPSDFLRQKRPVFKKRFKVID